MSQETKNELATKSSSAVSTDTSGLDFFSKLSQKANEGTKLLSPQECTNTVFSKYGEELASKYYNIYNTIHPADPGDIWRPTLIGIASKKSTNEIINSMKEGKYYIHETSVELPEDILMFPLFTNIEHTWWSSEYKAICRSMDGSVGDR